MPLVDEFARAQAMPAAEPSTSELMIAARRARAAALRAWMSAAWRMLGGAAMSRPTPGKRRRERPVVPTAVDWTAWRGE